MKSTSTTVVLTALANLMAFTLGAHDWPEFRGPTGQGLSPAKDVPIRWSATENVAWKMERDKLIDECAKERGDAASARKEKNRYILEYNRLRGIR